MLIALVLAVAGPVMAADVLVCTSENAPEEIRNAAAELAETAPLLKALQASGSSRATAQQTSEGLLEPAAYNLAAQNHLVVIGRPSQDPLMKKVLGEMVGIDEETRRLQSLGWGQFEGDVGWIESDRNPFLHSRRTKAAPDGTLLVKISGTSDAGVLAAVRAFQHGMLNGIVPAGTVSRPKTTLLDLDPLTDPAPVDLPETITINGKPAYLAGWSQIPANEYRAVLETTGTEPARMWRYKYLVPGFLGKKSLERWLSGPSLKAYGNTFEIIEFAEESAASQGVLKMTREGFKSAGIEGFKSARTGPQATDEVMEKPIWNITTLAAGRNIILATLPPDQTATLARLVQGATVKPQ
ncbi:hypothetical protein TSACC_2954 [Terrimicrobium sacchariphilum]|uniref:Uncharacterized protein n=1 Tax=Terrimicrobium sacchariphilum TaxID=690879 RepID=A0A146G428_TERSA|nr:hypothetical protein [Terrimicrobium sacchariphilum]GAT32555.1 hypothetical protein TSACC_2954 [Terrimicrobium sacchariphilum]